MSWGPDNVYFLKTFLFLRYVEGLLENAACLKVPAWCLRVRDVGDVLFFSLAHRDRQGYRCFFHGVHASSFHQRQCYIFSLAVDNAMCAALFLYFAASVCLTSPLLSTSLALRIACDLACLLSLLYTVCIFIGTLATVIFSLRGRGARYLLLDLSLSA